MRLLIEALIEGKTVHTIFPSSSSQDPGPGPQYHTLC